MGDVLIVTAFIVLALLALGSIVIGFIVQSWWVGKPYTLKKADSRQRWSWAIMQAACWIYIPMMLAGTGIAISELLFQGTDGFEAMECLLGFIAPFIMAGIMGLIFRFNMAMDQKGYDNWDRNLRDPLKQELFKAPFFFKLMFKLLKLLPSTKEYKEFFERGYSEKEIQPRIGREGPID